MYENSGLGVRKLRICQLDATPVRVYPPDDLAV
ncbi:MAG: hypothetical protein QOJ69_718, partial [Actinomycetota bacterium]|nr:hypothetical protein [Actinomycetota bacterium]